MTATHSTHPARKRGRCLATWCGLFSCLLLLPAHVVLGFAGGDGSAQNPYLIATAGHLDAVRNHHGAHFRLIADIDLGVAPWNDGMGWNPIGSVDRGFSGALDGAGFVIRNLTCMRPGVTYQGLFGVVSEATLRRVRLENAQVSGARFAGGLAGLAKDSVLRNLESTGGSITGQAHVGGLIGSLHGGSLHHASCAASVTGQDQVGGLGGSAYGADIQRTSAGGQVQGTREVGGLFGALGAEVPSELPQVLDYSPKSTSAGSPVFVLFDGDIGGLQEQITATFGSTPLPLTAFSESILQVILPANATSGDLRVHLGAASTAALPLVVAGPVTEPLFSRQVSPAADDQVIRHGDAVAIRIPPSILDQTRELSVSIVTHAPASPLNPADTTALDISIAGLTQLAAPIQVSLTYDPARLDPSRGAAEQMSVVRWDDELQIWIEMPYAVTEATQEIHFLTDHLSLFEVPIVGTMAKTAVKTLAGVATGPLVAEWLAGKVADTTYITPLGNFRFFFNKAEWDALAATWTRPGILGGMSYDPNHPASIQDIGTLFEVALANYLSRGFRNPVRKPGWLWGESVTPITVTIGGLWMESIGLLMEQSPEYNRVFGTITMPSRRVRNFNTDAPKKYATIGHELFHRIQAEYYSADRFGSIIGSDDYWWIEASAEYAGCREAWGRNNKAFDSVLSAGMQTDLLAYPLNATGMKPGWSRDLEYVHAAFIRFLVDQRNLDFKTMAERVSEGEPFNRLDYVIGAAGKDSLDIFYTYFATWAALVKESVLSAFTLADFKDLHSPTPENSEIVSRKDILSLQADRTLRVSRTGGETGINSVHLFLIPENTRIDPVDAYGRPGYHPPPGFFKRALYAMDPSADLNDLEPNRVLYLLANNGEASASLNVTIEVLNDGKPEGTPLRHVFDLPGGYSAQLWAVKLLAGKVEIASLPPSAPAASRWFPTLQSALDAAAEGADIRVYPGVFEEPGALTIDIRKSVNLRAVKGPEETILRANTIGWNRWIVIYETAANVRIEGFTIEPGAVRPTWASSGVIGIEARPGTRVNILGNHFNGFTWAAIYAQGATGILSRNVFAGNDTGIQAINAPELITVNGNTIRDGRIGVSLTNSAALIKGNTIESGTGSGIRIRGASSGTVMPGEILIEQNVIRNNRSSANGGGIDADSYSSLGLQAIRIQDGNTLTGNQAGGDGGGIYIQGAAAVIDRNTITDNQAGGDGGGTRGGSTIYGNTLTGNRAGGDGGGICGGTVICGNSVSANWADGYGGGIYAIHMQELRGNEVSGNHAGQQGGGIYGYAANWERTAWLQVEPVEPLSPNPLGRWAHVPTFSPPFTHPYNAVSGNSHGVTLAAFGPGDLQRTTNGGYDVSWPVTGGKAAEAADPTVSAEPPAAVIAAKSVSLVSLAKNEDENEGPAFALSDSFSRATVSGVEEVGGLVGTCLGVAVRRCYGAGQVDAAGEPRGGLAGSIGEGALAEAAYWDREVSSLATSAIGESRTTAAMTSPHADDTYLDWDFATVWSADADGSANSGYPRLREAVVPFFGVAVMSAAPGEGSVSGQSFLPEGGLATVFALAASGHEFRHWTENGTVVSTAAEFTFAVTEARNLVAHFQEAVETVATPEFDPPGGGFATATVAVQVTCPTAGATIRYTLDGSEPTEQSIALASGGTVAVPVPGTLSARAWMDGMAPSVVRIAFYVEGFPGGDGSIRDPYQVVTRRDLEAINDDRHAHYILMNDIDLAGTTYAGAVIAGSIDTPFTGSFDGRGFALTNLRIETATRYVGLFGAVSATGRITNVHIENGSVTGARDVGALAGFSLGSITACRATGEVNGTGDRSAGGLVGWNQGTMSRCAAAVRTTGTTRVGGLVGVNLGSIDTSHAEGNVVGSGERVGGLVGSHEGALSDCYARGNANGSAVVGGLVGRNYQGKVSRCYATGRPTGASSVGGLTGSVTASGAYEDTANFWDTESSQMATSAMGTGKTTAQMRNAATFLAAGWDFDEVWAMDPTENDGYPHFHTPVPTYTITVDAQPTDGGTVQGGGTYAHGQEATVRATAGNGWVFLNWTAGGTVVSAAADFAFSVTGHRDLVAHFQEVLETVATPEFDPAGGAFPGPRVTVTVTCATDGATIRYTTSGADPTETSLTIASGGTVEVDVPGTLKAKAWMAGRVPSQVRSAFYVLGPAEGDGTAGNPYRIVTRAHLEAVNDDVAAHYVLVNDIDLAGTTYDGALIAPSSDDPFTGSLDGQGFALTGLRILSAARNVGLFGCLGATGAVRNLRLENCAITGGNGVGGLVGHNLGTVTNTRVTGTVSGTGTVDVGGLAAWNQGTLSHCSATVRTTGNDFVGGLVAYNQGTISHCDAAGDVVGLGERVGGLVGDSEGPITDSYATGNVEGSGTMVGGLVGANAGTIAEAHATGDVLGQSERVGGLVGDNGGSIADAYASGRVEGKDRLVGGLAGTNFGTIARSHATGNVTATRERVGGLVGSNGSSGTIAQTYATGEVTGGNTYAGGLVGVNFGTIADSYARGNVAAAGMLGGLLGHNQQGKLIRCYATGRPEGTFSPGGVTGAVSVGGAYEDTGNFWNTESSQIAISAMGTGKTTDQMRNAATFIAAGWDFDGVWAMDPAENDGYPHFRTSLSTYTITATAQPADGGTVQGGGTYAHGQEVTVRATAGDGWVFLNWTDGGSVVSTAAQYAFTANAPRNLVARFAVKTLPAILWNAPPPIAFGTALGPAQLSATANTDGTFTYTPPAGTVLPIGRHTLRVDFAPHDAELWSAAFAEQILDVVPNGGVPDESLATLDEGDVMAGRGWWNLTGAYAIIPVAGSSMTLRLVHDPSGRVSGVATYTVAEGTTVIMPVRGTVKGASGRVTMTCSMRGSNPARTVTVSMALVLTVDSACRKLTGPLTGSVKANGATSTVTRSLVLDLPGDMDGTWSLAFELDQAGGAVNGTALLTFSNGVSHPFSVGGRTEDDGKAVLTLAGDESDPAASRIGIRTTIAPLEDSSVRLDAFSGIGYGQILRW